MSDKFRFQFCPAVELGPHFHVSKNYSSYEEANLACNAIADYTLDLHKFSAMRDYSNFSFIEQWDGKEWIEVDEDELLQKK